MFQCLHADSSRCTVAVYFNVYMYICKCIIINIIIALEPVFFFISVHIRLVLAGQFILHFTLLIISKIFTPSVYFAPVTLTEEQILNRESFQTGVLLIEEDRIKCLVGRLMHLIEVIGDKLSPSLSYAQTTNHSNLFTPL